MGVLEQKIEVEVLEGTEEWGFEVGFVWIHHMPDFSAMKTFVDILYRHCVEHLQVLSSPEFSFGIKDTRDDQSAKMAAMLEIAELRGHYSRHVLF